MVRSGNDSLFCRRRFILKSGVKTTISRHALACVTFISVAMAQAPPWPVDANAYRLHTIGNAHIDPVWLWPWQEGLSVAHSTFRSALDRLNGSIRAPVN